LREFCRAEAIRADSNVEIDTGTTQWDSRDVWEDLADHNKNNRVRDGAAILEHFGKEACQALRALVEYRAGAVAAKRSSTLQRMGKSARE
jgi:hypothetical protein